MVVEQSDLQESSKRGRAGISWNAAQKEMWWNESAREWRVRRVRRGGGVSSSSGEVKVEGKTKQDAGRNTVARG